MIYKIPIYFLTILTRSQRLIFSFLLLIHQISKLRIIGKWKIQRRIRLSVLSLRFAHSRYYRATIESSRPLSKNEIERRYLEAVNEPAIDRVAHHLRRLTTHRRKQIHNLRLPKREKHAKVHGVLADFEESTRRNHTVECPAAFTSSWRSCFGCSWNAKIGAILLQLFVDRIMKTKRSISTRRVYENRLRDRSS